MSITTYIQRERAIEIWAEKLLSKYKKWAKLKIALKNNEILENFISDDKKKYIIIDKQ